MRGVLIAAVLGLASCQQEPTTVEPTSGDLLPLSSTTTPTTGTTERDVVTQRVEAPGYSVESRSYTDANGDIHVRSSDTMGNTYGVDSRSYTEGNKQVIESSDTMGNSYRVESSCSASGSCTTTDSMGNRCTITSSGQMIGCGM